MQLAIRVPGDPELRVFKRPSIAAIRADGVLSLPRVLNL